VYSAVQASAWAGYRAMGVDPGITDCGSLLRRLSQAESAEPRSRTLKTA
jgi:hypothetical protein